MTSCTAVGTPEKFIPTESACTALNIYDQCVSPSRPWATRTVAMVAPLVYWTADFAFLRAGYGVTWILEIWLGSVVWVSLSGLVLSVLMQPAPVPLTAWNRGSSTATATGAQRLSSSKAA